MKTGALTTCACGKTLDAATSVDDLVATNSTTGTYAPMDKPTANDVTLCGYCGRFYRFNNDLSLCPASAKFLRSLPAGTQRELAAVRRALLRIKGTSGHRRPS